ncbi:hypothetical protein OG613_49130 (plasmid) [Streptomyces sp. NBC_00015]|uniref:hypothetical protein n=1 Tax=Streptomyces sp. NBC_00015 TaxID=2903611 RepID=UPI002F90CCD7
MTQPHPDNFRLRALLAEHDQSNGNAPGPDGKIAGYDSFSLLGAAGVRASMMFEGFGPLRKVLPPEHHEEIIKIMAALWKDGFAVGARSQQTDA